VPVSEFLRAMARVAPADLAAALRELAGPGPGETGQGLAALYEKHAGEFAAIEAAYKVGPSQTAR